MHTVQFSHVSADCSYTYSAVQPMFRQIAASFQRAKTGFTLAHASRYEAAASVIIGNVKASSFTQEVPIFRLDSKFVI